jgi:hypothetical protein
MILRWLLLAALFLGGYAHADDRPSFLLYMKIHTPWAPEGHRWHDYYIDDSPLHSIEHCREMMPYIVDLFIETWTKRNPTRPIIITETRCFNPLTDQTVS